MSLNFAPNNCVIRWAGRLVFTSSLMALSLAPIWAAENTKKPISRERLFRAVEIGGLANDEFVGIIKDFGVEFELTPEDRQELAKAGVDEKVMEAIGANYRDPIKERVAQLGQGGPLAKENVIGLLKAGAGSEIVEALVDKRGISFAMTPADAKEIESAGGSKGLLGGLLLKEPVKVAAVEPAATPAKTVTANPAATLAAKEPMPMVSDASVMVPEAAKVAAQLPVSQAPASQVPSVSLPAPQTSAPAAEGAHPGSQPAPSVAPLRQEPVNQAAAMLTTLAKPAKLIKGGVQYSEIARRTHATGKVVMSIVISEQGRVEQVKGVNGNPILMNAAAQSMKAWIYEPATIDGRATKVSTQVAVEFQ